MEDKIILKFKTKNILNFYEIGALWWPFMHERPLKPKDLMTLRVTTGCILPIGYSVLLPWIQTCYLKKQKLFSIRVKKLFEPTVLRKKSDGFLLFLKTFSWETNLWVTLGDFKVKQRKNWEGISVFNWKSIKLKWCAVPQIITIICVTNVQKNF